MPIDLRKTLRALGQTAQEDLVRRLTGGEDVHGGAVAPQVVHAGEVSKKRVRVLGERVQLRELAGTVGIKTGALLKELQKKANLRVTRTSFRFIPGSEVLARWFALNAGSKHQVARPIGGLAAGRAEDFARELVREARDQTVVDMRPGAF